MRIFGGSARGRFINVPKGADLRPSTDKVRLALFNAISALVPGSRFLDLYCGSGSVGLEALSRGAAFVAFVDSQRPCIDGVREAIQAFGFAESDWQLLAMSHERGLKQLAGGRPFDLIFMDPPYDAALGKASLQLIRSLDLLARHERARIILEHAGADESPQVEGLALYRRYDHGAASLSVYGREGEQYAH